MRGAVEIARLIRQRAVSAVEVVQSFVRRIEAVNPSINAVVTLTVDAGRGPVSRCSVHGEGRARDCPGRDAGRAERAHRVRAE